MADLSGQGGSTGGGFTANVEGVNPGQSPRADKPQTGQSKTDSLSAALLGKGTGSNDSRKAH